MGLQERRQRERQARRRAIMNAARSLLLEKGLDAVSIPQIARRAELGVGTIYSYYASKEEIFARLQQEGLEILLEHIRAAVAQQTAPEQCLLAVARVYTDFSRRHSDYFDVINYFLSTPRILLGDELKQEVDRCGRRIIETIAHIIARAEPPPADPFADAVMFWATLHGLLQLRKLQSTVFADKDHQALVDHAVARQVAMLVGPAGGRRSDD